MTLAEGHYEQGGLGSFGLLTVKVRNLDILERLEDVNLRSHQPWGTQLCCEEILGRCVISVRATEVPLLKDTLNKGFCRNYLPTKDTF